MKLLNNKTGKLTGITLFIILILLLILKVIFK